MSETQEPTIVPELSEPVVVASEKKQKLDPLDEINQLMDDLEQTQRDFQNAYNHMNSIHRNLKKTLQKYLKKSVKRGRGRRVPQLDANGVEIPRKPCGFELPTSISDELCAFLGCAPGVMIPRTEVSKQIAKYITDNHLKHPDKKRIIVPDAKLSALLGPDAKDQELTHFSMNKFLKHHFPPKKVETH